MKVIWDWKHKLKSCSKISQLNQNYSRSAQFLPNLLFSFFLRKYILNYQKILRTCQKITATYRFKSVVYGFTDMPAELQKGMDCTLVGLKNTHLFPVDILNVGRGSLEDLKNLMHNCLRKLDNNLRINLAKYHFAKQKLEWLDAVLHNLVISPSEAKKFHHLIHQLFWRNYVPS